MSFCGSLIRRVLEAGFVFLLITFLPGLPPNMEFTAYSVTEPRELEGVLAVNNKLNGAERIGEGELIGPEGFAVANKTLYFGLKGGEIKKLSPNGKISTVINLGRPCGGYWDEQNCGRPLGMQFDKHGMLYVVDSFYGIYKVNVATGKSMQIISTEEPIEGKIAKTANSVAVSNDGSAVYWTVSSCDVGLHNGVLSFFGDGSGRVFKFDPIKKTNTLLMDKLHFANGIVLSSKEDFLVVAETHRARLLRLKTFPSPHEVLAPYPVVRRFLARLLSLIEMPFELIHRNFPNEITGKITFWVNNFEMIMPLFPKALIVLEVNEAGEVIDTLQSTDNNVCSVSDIVFVDQTYYLGSPFNEYLGRVKTRIPIHVKVSTDAPPTKS
ncbi:hypothetical protein B566_EDAN007808 [Ephemera danica]|nr:hypothetical protein B566_EDAN007808 [Ephemera danica]